MKQGLKHSRESSRVENLVKDRLERTRLFSLNLIFSACRCYRTRITLDTARLFASACITPQAKLFSPKSFQLCSGPGGVYWYL